MLNAKRCPAEAELLAYADAVLPPEHLERVQEHLDQCSSCARQIRALQEIIEDIHAPVGQPSWAVPEHVASVMARLDKGTAALPLPARRAPKGALWGGGAALAAAAALLLVFSQSPSPETPLGTFAARGGPAEAALSRDVGVQVYAQEARLRPLSSGSRIQPKTPLTVGLRNLGRERAFLLLFAVDAKNAVHWIAPAYTDPASNPEAAAVNPSKKERLLGTSAVFDDLASGPLRIVALITAKPTHVADIEALAADQLTDLNLMKRFSQSELRQIQIEVTSERPQ